MKKFVLLVYSCFCLALTVNAQPPGDIIRVPIGSLFTGMKGRPFAEARMLDAGHLLITIRPCVRRGYACVIEPKSYATVDLAGKLLGRMSPPPSADLYPLLNGSLLLREKDDLKVLDQHLATLNTYPCNKKACTDELPEGRGGVRRLCLTEDPHTCHLLGYSGEIPNEMLGGPSLRAGEVANPLTDRLTSLDATQAYLVDPNELWFLNKKNQVSYLTVFSGPTSIGRWFPLAKENCGMEFSSGKNPRMLATCSDGIKIDYDDGIPLWQEINVFDVHTHTMILRRTLGSTTGTFLSPDGHFLGWVKGKHEFVELQPLP